ncbi:MAG: TerB family tellurite resistance protein [Ginsengibacter sp.]
MIKPFVIVLFIILSLTGKCAAQSDETQQLLLNVEKLAQLKNILNDMYKGYQIVSKGYNTIKDISKGNFNLHDVFLNGLMQVSPGVKKYKRIADIISYQIQLVKEYKIAFKRFKKSNLFNTNEIKYIENVYGNLFKKSLENLDELAVVITSNKLRMSDDERLNAIDRIFNEMSDKLVFLKTFNRENNVLAIQRGREMIDTKISKQLNGL